MNPLHVLEQLKATYGRFVETFQDYRNDEIRAWMRERVREGRFLWRQPFLTLRRRYRHGASLSDLVEAGLLHRRIPEIFRGQEGRPIRSYQHQANAWEILLAKDRNCVVATGTGSGKSFCFAVPVVSAALAINEERGIPPSGPRGVKALLVYPMNALANSQYEDIARRLAGTGVTICNYTGDLRDDPEKARQAHAENTGRAEPWDSEVISREELRQGRGADILVTNYVMLELILTRFEDRNVFPFGRLADLRYLVLDEIHTHTGRGGADVACLVRRLKEHTRTTGRLRCIGTSATIESASAQEAHETIAQFARALFGEEFSAEDVVTESYGAHLTPEIPDDLPAVVAVREADLDAASEDDGAALGRLRDALCGKENASPDSLRRQATVQFVERALIPESDEGAPPAVPWDELVEGYREARRQAATPEECARELAAALLVGAATDVETPEEDTQSLLLPKVHSFFSQGQTVTSCLGHLHLSATGETVCSTCTEQEVPAFPLVFCAACGQECFSADLREEDTLRRVLPRDFGFGDGGETPVYLFPEPWDRDDVPPEESAVKKDGTARKGRAGAVPVNVSVCTACGALGDSCDHDAQKEMALIFAPLLLCPTCGVVYDGRIREFNKFFVAGAVGKATATDVLVSRLTDIVPAEPKRRVIAFTDNRQDAAFQAAHLTDLDRRFHFRRALYRGLLAKGASAADSAVVLPDSGGVAFGAMQAADRLPVIAPETGTKVGRAARATEGLYKRYLTFATVCEITGRPRRMQPSLETVGLLGVTYDGIDDLAAEDSFWIEIALLRGAEPARRRDVVQVFLDGLRRAGAVEGRALPDREELQDQIVYRLNPDVVFHDASMPPLRPVVFSDELPVDTWQYAVRRLAGAPGSSYLPSFVRWIRKVFDVDRDDAVEMTRSLASLLLRDDVKLLVEGTGRGGGHFVRIPEARLLLYARQRDSDLVCPRCGLRWELARPLPCPSCVKVDVRPVVRGPHYFREQYTADLAAGTPILAAEHSAQVSGDERLQYENRFEDADDALNVLVCTPTMELGIDIGGLSAVYMRNVPPSPANYAQRQGRAGRHGQPAFVATFCGTFGRYASHDQYFFRFPGRIIAGRIAAPRFLLDNRSLLEAHMHALVLEVADIRLPIRPKQFLRMGSDEDVRVGVPMMESFRDEQLAPKVAAAKDRIVASARRAFTRELDQIGLGEADVEHLVDRFAEDFDHAFRDFRAEYVQLQEEFTLIHQRMAHEGGTREDEIRERAVKGRMADMREGNGDFYVYRYLGTQGFLPNYAFPRRASRVYFTDRKENLSRKRTLALREFAPRTTIYYRGNRYRVERAQPRARGEAHQWNRLKVCECGNFYLDQETAGASACAVCGNDLMATHTYDRVLTLPDAVARRAGRISADEEERTRRGFDIRPYYHLGASPRTDRVMVGDVELATVTYAHHGELLQVNHGPRARDEEGFRYCSKCRLWIDSESGEERHLDDQGRNRCPEGGTEEDVHRGVLLYVRGTHDFVVLEIDVPDGVDADEFGWSLGTALLFGFQVAYSVDESEVNGFLFPVPGQPTRRRILLYEEDEGGAGLMENLTGPGAWRRVAERALEIIHVDPRTGEDLDGACDRCCYDCLFSYYNQHHHEHLNRTTIVDALRRMVAADALVPVSEETGLDWDTILASAVGSEPVVVQALADRGFPVPTAQHAPVRDAEGVPCAPRRNCVRRRAGNPC